VGVSSTSGPLSSSENVETGGSLPESKKETRRFKSDWESEYWRGKEVSDRGATTTRERDRDL